MSAKSTTTGTKREYFIDFGKLEKYSFNSRLTTANGKVVKGDTMYVGMITKKQGSGSRPHTHPFEQFNYVVKGVLKACVAGEERLVHPGGLVHIPANTVHTTIADPATNADCVYLMIKEATALGTSGIPENPELDGPRYEPGFEPK